MGGANLGSRSGLKWRADSHSTIELGERLGLSVIAEGIEDNATAELLAAMGCEEGQGYYFGKPMPASEFESRFLVVHCCQLGGGSGVIHPALSAHRFPASEMLSLKA
jgi:hypothetical protein